MVKSSVTAPPGNAGAPSPLTRIFRSVLDAVKGVGNVAVGNSPKPPLTLTLSTAEPDSASGVHEASEDDELHALRPTIRAILTKRAELRRTIPRKNRYEEDSLSTL